MHDVFDFRYRKKGIRCIPCEKHVGSSNLKSPVHQWRALNASWNQVSQPSTTGEGKGNCNRLVENSSKIVGQRTIASFLSFKRIGQKVGPNEL